MRIALVSPLFESVPPQFYGGTERVVFYLVEELVRQGHEVSLFASADSLTGARLRPQGDQALRLAGCRDPIPAHLLMLDDIIAEAGRYDVIHFHIDYLHFPHASRLGVPLVTTMHGRLDLPDITALFHKYRYLPFVSISHDQRKPMPWLNWVGTVYHGLPRDLYRFVQRPDGYLAFLGRICPEKRPDRAAEIARRAGIPLRIAAKVDKADQAYFNEQIRPLLADPLVEFVGEIDDSKKTDFLGNARAVLFPVDWPEPFGLVMIEAMACGTPVIAFCSGSVPEVLDEGKTGFIVQSVDEAVAAVQQVQLIDRTNCREVFEKRFSAERMAKDYVQIYSQLIATTKIATDVSTINDLPSRDYERPLDTSLIGPTGQPYARPQTG